MVFIICKEKKIFFIKRKIELVAASMHRTIESPVNRVYFSTVIGTLSLFMVDESNLVNAGIVAANISLVLRIPLLGEPFMNGKLPLALV